MKDDHGLQLRPVALDGPEGLLLVGELQQEYVVRYGGQDETPIDPRSFDRPEGVFLVAELGGELVGCAGLRRHEAGIAELKRMYVRAGCRRRGLARTLLTAIEDQARQLGYRQLILETGSRQPEAVALYETSGYRPTANFGWYQDSGMDSSYVKDL
jgi:GNAT superfamily N-acetyltransferase